MATKWSYYVPSRAVDGPWLNVGQICTQWSNHSCVHPHEYGWMIPVRWYTQLFSPPAEFDLDRDYLKTLWFSYYQEWTYKENLVLWSHNFSSNFLSLSLCRVESVKIFVEFVEIWILFPRKMHRLPMRPSIRLALTSKVQVSPFIIDYLMHLILTFHQCCT